jgi:hypothetical protein
MKLNEILNESTTETYLVNLKDGAGFNVTASSSQEAREKAKGKLRAGQVIKNVIKDVQGSSDLESKKSKLKKFVENSRNLQKEPSQQKKFIRQIDNATTAGKLQTISDAISAYGDKSDTKKEQRDDKD